jgi:hypothetical protein
MGPQSPGRYDHDRLINLKGRCQATVNLSMPLPHHSDSAHCGHSASGDEWAANPQPKLRVTSHYSTNLRLACPSGDAGHYVVRNHEYFIRDGQLRRQASGRYLLPELRRRSHFRRSEIRHMRWTAAKARMLDRTAKTINPMKVVIDAAPSEAHPTGAGARDAPGATSNASRRKLPVRKAA